MPKYLALANTLIAILLSSHAYADEVRLYNWTDYLEPSVTEAFKAASGHDVTEDYFDTESLRDELINSGRGGAFDLILVDGWSLSLMSEKQLFHKVSELTKELSTHIDPRWQEACGDYGIPYSWGTMGIMHRESISKTPITSWRQLFHPPAGHSGHIAMYDDAVDAPVAALLVDGADPFTSDIQALKLAYTHLKAQRPHVMTYQYGDAYAEEHGSASTMTMTMGYSGDEYSISENTEQDDWVYVVPQEGTVLWVECWAFPIDNPINQATLDFVKFLSQPEIAAQNAESVWMASPIPSAVELTSEEYQSDDALFPSEQILERSHLYKVIDAEGQLTRFKMMTSLK
ncbi:spermidine/putrescine ABC transporter substrate-binding protein [Neiella marina]|uniref:Spermidine/putrescine ABC transporter substrate-binding protein n=1 Tax=Neiella holothuriorum TaxID=2870530 RepID=A0ABS7EJR5_9GAMM|nr:spermidine/putrescine ABC transporter substrate-binding protein [Neiella holothuriorum]MBW8191902.1 spermidine/putrescine ABC transporter substrate-binding protein [Neiella holothuriorum]